MTFKGFIQRNDGAVLAEMVLASAAFIVIAIIVAGFAAKRHSTPIAELQTERYSVRLVVSD